MSTENKQEQEQAKEEVKKETAQVNFESFNFNENIKRGIDAAGFKVASPIQALSIPLILDGRDMIGQAHTGTGKTAAFGLPTMNNMDFNSGVEILVITPTRELANQVSDELYMLGRYANVKTVTIYGGKSSRRQLDLVNRGAQIVVATPGRLLDLLSSKQLRNFNPKTVVLDEADEMLDMGFLDDIKEIFSYIQEDRQTLLFSATMPTAIKRLASDILRNPEFIGVTKKETTNTDITQQYYVIEDHERDVALMRIIDAYDVAKAIIFCRTKREVERVSTHLIAQGYASKGLHGDMEQNQREEVIKSFRDDKLEILVATDVAARGLSVNGVTHVFNYHIPFDSESYVHRIGRTGRAGAKGVAITLVTPLEFKELQRIRKSVGTTIAHAMIPSRKHVTELKIEKFASEILNVKIKEDATEILEVLGDQTDVQTLLLKTISLMLSTKGVKGPDNIGISGDKLERLLKNLDHGHHTGSNRGRGGYRGNRSRNGGGGGGYRGNRNSDRGNNRSGGGGDRNRSDRNRGRSNSQTTNNW
jgi:ATP-dependent RNA helicase DeaD